MLTDASPLVDVPRPAGLWLSVSALAKARGVSKQAISKNLARWTALGSPITCRREGRALLVNVAEYDRAKGDLGDLAHQQGDETKADAPADASAGVYSREQARRMAYVADLSKLELDEKLKKLVPVDDIERAAIMCGEAIVRAIDQIITKAEDVAASVAKDGVAGARQALKNLARDLRTRAAEEFAKLPAAASGSAKIQPEDEPLDS